MTSAALHFTNFGRFEIVRKLGRSMSDVYLAHDPAMNRQVVLKIVEQCHDSFARAIVDAERRGAVIQQQAHAIDARILEIYDVGEQDGSFFVAMQYAEGRSLADLIKEEGRIDARQAARYAAEICSQLASLHSFDAEIDGKKRAVVHGDIKPSNIQIGPEGEVRLLDFGIAKAISATRKLTHHDLGSPAYCSPERLHNSQVDPHSDLWAVGVCLYEMIAGLPPYQAQTTRKLENVIQSRRPPRALPPTCPTVLRAIIQKALAADSARRYSSAAEFERDLHAYLASRHTVAETDREHFWHVNATVENSQPSLHQEKRTVRRSYSALVTKFKSVRGSLIAGVLSGFFVFVPAVHIADFWTDSAALRNVRDYGRAGLAEIDKDFQLYSRLERDYRWLGGLSPVVPLKERFRGGLVSAANQMMTAYRNNAGAELQAFDWSHARACLQRAATLSPDSVEIRGKLALAEAYEDFVSGPGETTRRMLEESSLLLPQSPDPQLVLARFYVYHESNLGLAVAAWHTAERLGYRLGPREWEQEGDAYLARVDSGLRQLKSAASRDQQVRLYSLLQRDVSRARSRYEPIAGFGRTRQSLDKLDRLERAASTLQAERARRQAAQARRASRTRTWR